MILFNKRVFYISNILGIILFGGLFSACDIMGGWYDDTLDGKNPEEKREGTNSDVTGKEETQITDEDGNQKTVTVISGQFYVDATSYTQWIYINLHGEEPVFTTSTISLDDLSESGVPEQWDFALHRYDVKTNGGKVMMTTYHSITELEAAGLPADGTWVEDSYSENSITVDMSHMMEGYLIYAPGNKNTEAGKWLNVDTSNMPPDYTMYDNVMIYQFTDGSYAAIQLEDFMSNDRYKTKGWMTVNYKYPVFI